MNVTRRPQPQQSDVGLYRHRPAARRAARRPRSSTSTMSARCRRPRCGAPTRARTVPAPSRWCRRAAPRTDLVADGAIQSGEIGAYLQMRDTILPQAQTQLDEFANQMSQALSNQTTSGTAVTSGGQSGYRRRCRRRVAGQFDPAHLYRWQRIPSTPSRSCRSAPAARCRRQTAASNANNQVIGVDFSGGMSSVVSQLNAALGSNLQFSNPSGTVLQVLNTGGTQRRQCAVGDFDRDLADQRQPATAVVPRRHSADHRRDHRGRLADHGACRAHHRQQRACCLALEPGRLRAEHRVRRLDAAEFHAQPAEQRVC